MSFSGKKSPLLLNAESQLISRQGININPDAVSWQGSWLADEPYTFPVARSYTPGELTESTVLKDLTNSLPNFYQQTPGKLSINVWRNLLNIGRPLDDSSVNCPALGNSRPDAFKTSYAGYGSFMKERIGDKFYNPSKYEVVAQELGYTSGNLFSLSASTTPTEAPSAYKNGPLAAPSIIGPLAAPDPASYQSVHQFRLNYTAPANILGWKNQFNPTGPYVFENGKEAGTPATGDTLSMSFVWGQPGTLNQPQPPGAFKFWIPPGTVFVGLSAELPQWVPYAVSMKMDTPPSRTSPVNCAPGTWPRPPVGSGAWEPGGEYQQLLAQQGEGNYEKVIFGGEETVVVYAGNTNFPYLAYWLRSDKNQTLDMLGGVDGRWCYVNVLPTDFYQPVYQFRCNWVVDKQTYLDWYARASGN